jgi:hypothetical protein
MKFDRTITRLLRSFRQRVRAIDFVTLSCAYVGFAVLFFLAAATTDRWFILDKKVRIGVLSIFGLASLGYLLLALLVLFRRISSLYLAKKIEKANPSLGDGLLTYVQMARGEATIGEEFIKAISDRVSASISGGGVALAPATPKRFLRVAAYFAATASVFFLATAAAVGQPFFVCLRRVMFPRSNILPPTLTQIAEVWPGDTTTLLSKPVEVHAAVSGLQVSSVLLYYSHDEKSWFYVSMHYADSEPQDVRGPLSAGRPSASGEQDESDAGVYRAFWCAQLPAFEKDAVYFIAAGDTKSDQFRVSVVPPPAAQVVRVQLRPPVYSGMPAKEIQGGNVDALLGTEATVVARATRPLRKCALVRGDRPPEPLPPPKPGKEQEFNVSFSVERTEPYYFLCEDEFGFKSENPVKYDVVARKDIAPTVHIVSPGSVEVPHNQEFVLLVTAADDCGVKELSLSFRVKDRPGGRWKLPFRGSAPEKTASHVKQFVRNTVVERTLTPAELGLKSGDSMLYFVQAQDTCEPQANIGVSELCILKVLPPVPDEKRGQQPEDDAAAANAAAMAQANQSLAALRSLKELLDALRGSSPDLFSSPGAGGDASPLTPWELERLERLEEELADSGESDDSGEYEDDYDDLLSDEEDEALCECDGT